MFGAYAADFQGYDVTGAYKTADEVSKESTGVDGKNSQKSQSFQLVDTLSSTMDVLAPQLNMNYQAMLDNPNIPTSAKLGVLGFSDAALTAMVYNPPSVDVVGHLAEEWVPNYDPATTGVYAETGYNQLQSMGISTLWNIMRNVAYILFVIVLIVAGFMIMFRHKIGGQTMVTVYNTIPNIIVGLVLVTFSFAIVGLLIDLGVFLQGMIVSILDIQVPLMPNNPLQLWFVFTAKSFTQDIGNLDMSAGGIIGRFFEGFLEGGLNLGAGFINVFTGNSPLDMLIMFIVSLIAIWASIKVFITLVKAYIGLIMDTIIAPLVLAIAAIPGRQFTGQDWINRVLKNILTFVLVFFLVNLPLYIMEKGLTFDLFSVGLGQQSNAGNFAWAGTDKLLLGAISLYFFFLAAEVPKLLDEYFPQIGGKGMQEAMKGVSASASKIPLVGGFFK
jgi:hypothetical protein